MTTLQSARDDFLNKLISLDADGKIKWECNRTESVISGKIGENTISITEATSSMGFKTYRIKITGQDGVVLDKFTPESRDSFLGTSFDHSEEEDNKLFGLDRHPSDLNLRRLYQKSMITFFNENLAMLMSEMDDL